jgi:recombination protein RecA
MDENRKKALELALVGIEKQYGKGAVMRLDAAQEAKADLQIIGSGSVSLDIALGVGGFPRGRIVEVYGPESSGKTTLTLHAIAEAQKLGGVAAFIDAEHALDVNYARKLGVKVEELLVSQPDNGEQALEIADMLVRSGAVDIVVVDSVAALVPKAEIRGRHGRPAAGPPGAADEPGAAQAHRDGASLVHAARLHQPDSHEDRGDVWQPRDHHRAATR